MHVRGLEWNVVRVCVVYAVVMYVNRVDGGGNIVGIVGVSVCRIPREARKGGRWGNPEHVGGSGAGGLSACGGRYFVRLEGGEGKTRRVFVAVV